MVGFGTLSLFRSFLIRCHSVHYDRVDTVIRNSAFDQFRRAGIKDHAKPRVFSYYNSSNAILYCISSDVNSSPVSSRSLNFNRFVFSYKDLSVRL